MLAWLRTMRTLVTTSTERRALLEVLLCLHFHTHALWLKFATFTSSTWSSTCVRSLRLDLPFLLLALPSALFPLPHLHEVYGKPA